MGIIEGVNMNDVERPASIEAGIYTVRVVDSELVRNKTVEEGDENPFHIAVKYEVFGNDIAELNGRKINDRFSIKKRGLWKLEDMMKAAGVTPREGGGIDPEDLKGAELTIRVVIKNNWPEVTSYVPLA